MKLRLIFAIVVCSNLAINGQITFQKTYGGLDYDIGKSVQQTTDGGYILSGQTLSYGAGKQDMYLIKTDSEGVEQWYKTYGGSDWEFGLSAMQTIEGGYILCGGHSGLSSDTLSLIKTDSKGNEIWNKRYSASVNRDVGQFVQQTSDEGFIAVGFAQSNSKSNIYMVKTHSNGEVEWSKVLNSSGTAVAFEILETNDGGYALIGQAEDNGLGTTNMFLVKTNSLGDTIWTKEFGSTADEIGRSLYETLDNGFILLGYENFIGGNLYLVKTDSLGNEEWSNYYGGDGWDQGYSVQQTNDGGFILAGSKKNISEGTTDMYCIKTDNAGKVQWESTFPKGLLSDAHSVQQTADNGYILLGSTSDTISPFSDFYLVKINDLGVVSILENEDPPRNISVFPNPFSDYTTLQMGDSGIKEFSMTLFNSQGHIVKSRTKITTRQFRIEKNNLASGIYFFQLSEENEIFATGKLIME